jgi:hypothetical protein
MRRLVRLTNSQGPPPMRKSIAVRFGLEDQNRTAQPEAISTTVENQECPVRIAAKAAKAS